MTSKTECERLADVSVQSQTISDFIEWLEIEGIELSRPDVKTNGWSLPITERPDSLLLRYFGIDAIRLDTERRALLRAAAKAAGRLCCGCDGTGKQHPLQSGGGVGILDWVQCERCKGTRCEAAKAEEGET